MRLPIQRRRVLAESRLLCDQDLAQPVPAPIRNKTPLLHVVVGPQTNRTQQTDKQVGRKCKP